MAFAKKLSVFFLIILLFSLVSHNLHSGDIITRLDLSHIGIVIVDCEISDGVVYVSIQGDSNNPDYDCGVYAYDIEMGEELWFCKTTDAEVVGGGASWNLQVYGDSLYAIANGVGLIRIDRDSGDILNTYNTPETIISPFVIGDGILFMADKYCITAIDLNTDELMWRYEDERHESGMMPTITNLYYEAGRLYVGSIMPSVKSFDAKTGELIWNSDSPVGSYITIYHISDRYLYVINAGDVQSTLVVIDRETGEGVDSIEGCSYITSSDEVIILSDHNDHSLLAIDPDSVETLWKIYPEGVENLYGSDFVLVQGLLIIGGDTGVLFAIDTDTGEELWTRRFSDLPLRLVDGPEGVLSVITEEDDIHKVNLPFGETVWTKTMSDEIDAPFGVSGEYLYFSSAYVLTVFNAGEYKGDDDMKERETNITEPCWVNTILATKSEEEAQNRVAEVEQLLEFGDECGYLWIPDYASLSGEEYYLVFLGPYEKAETSQYIAGHYLWMNPDTYCIRVSGENERETLPPKYEFRGFFPSMDRLLINFQPQIYPDLPPGWHREDHSDLMSSSTVRFVVWNGEDKDTSHWYFSVYGSYQIGPYDVLVEQRFSSPDEAEGIYEKYCEYATETYGEPIRESDEYGYSVWEDSLIFGYGADEKKLEYTLTLDGYKLRFRMLVVEVKNKEIEWDEGN